jgi:hypothetical protein
MVKSGIYSFLGTRAVVAAVVVVVTKPFPKQYRVQLAI